jgi:hypothetical protein
LQRKSIVQPRTEETAFLGELAGAIWSNLTTLLIIDSLLLAAAMPVVLLALAGVWLLAPLVAVVTLGPLWAATIAVADRLNLGDDASLRTFARMVGRHGRTGAAVSGVPGVVATALLGTGNLLAAHPGERWLLLPLFVDGSVATLALLAAFSAFSLATTGGMTGVPLWRASLAVAAASPLTTLASIALLVLAWLGSTVFGPIVPVLLAAPLGLFLSATTWRSPALRRS